MGAGKGKNRRTQTKYRDDSNEYALSSDNVLMPKGVVFTLPYDLPGDDVNIPQMTPENCPNDHGRAFIIGLDRVFTELTRLDSRHQGNTLTAYESVMIRKAMYLELIKGTSNKKITH